MNALFVCALSAWAAISGSSELGNTQSLAGQVITQVSNVVSLAPARAVLFQKSENDSLRSYDQPYEPLGVLAGTSGLAACKTLASSVLFWLL